MPPEPVDLLLKNACIVTQDDHRTIIPDGGIAIRGGKIAGIGQTREVTQKFQAAETIDLVDQIVFPGLINTHTHLFQVSTKGLGEDKPVHEWVTVVTAPTAMRIRPDEMYLFCLEGCLEHIHSGVTTLVDMSYKAHSYELHEENIRAMVESGLRGRYTTIISDFGLNYGIPEELIKPIDWFIKEYSRLHAQFPATDRMAVWIAIGATWTITDLGLKEVTAYANATRTPIAMHISENYLDNQISQERYGKNIVPYLDEIGFLRPDLLAIHCVYTNQEDIAIYAQNDVKISYNPVSNMYLGSGIAPVVEMDRAGVTLSIGVDGAGSNNSQDMIESLKIAALLPKVGARDASVVSAQKILDWATRGAARSVGLENEIGSLEVGKCADLFVMSPNSSKFVPIHDPVASLVYSSGQDNIVMTVADGKILMKDRVIQHIDETALLTRCQETAIRLADRCGSNARLVRGYRPGGLKKS